MMMMMIIIITDNGSGGVRKGVGLQLQLGYPDPVCATEEGEVIPGKKDKESSQETSRIKRTGGENRDGKESW